jgi:hypothetical protein
MRTFITIVVAALILNSCELIPNGIKGNGNVKEKNIEVADFKGIDVGGGFDVYITKGDKPHVRILADENLLPHIEVLNANGNVQLKTHKNFWKYKSLKAFITYTELNELDASGGTDIIFENTVVAEDFLLKMSGGSDARVSVEAKTIRVELSGGADLDLKYRGEEIRFSGSGGSDGDLTVKGATFTDFNLSGGADADVIGDAEFCEVNCSGGSDFNGLGFKVRQAIVDASGAGDARLYVSEKIALHESGAGSVRFEGGAKKVAKSEINR